MDDFVEITYESIIDSILEDTGQDIVRNAIAFGANRFIFTQTEGMEGIIDQKKRIMSGLKAAVLKLKLSIQTASSVSKMLNNSVKNTIKAADKTEKVVRTKKFNPRSPISVKYPTSQDAIVTHANKLYEKISGTVSVEGLRVLLMAGIGMDPKGPLTEKTISKIVDYVKKKVGDQIPSEDTQLMSQTDIFDYIKRVKDSTNALKTQDFKALYDKTKDYSNPYDGEYHEKMMSDYIDCSLLVDGITLATKHALLERTALIEESFKSITKRISSDEFKEINSVESIGIESIIDYSEGLNDYVDDSSPLYDSVAGDISGLESFDEFVSGISDVSYSKLSAPDKNKHMTFDYSKENLTQLNEYESSLIGLSGQFIENPRLIGMIPDDKKHLFSIDYESLDECRDLYDMCQYIGLEWRYVCEDVEGDEIINEWLSVGEEAFITEPGDEARRKLWQQQVVQDAVSMANQRHKKRMELAKTISDPEKQKSLMKKLRDRYQKEVENIHKTKDNSSVYESSGVTRPGKMKESFDEVLQDDKFNSKIKNKKFFNKVAALSRALNVRFRVYDQKKAKNISRKDGVKNGDGGTYISSPQNDTNVVGTRRYINIGTIKNGPDKEKIDEAIIALHELGHNAAGVSRLDTFGETVQNADLAGKAKWSAPYNATKETDDEVSAWNCAEDIAKKLGADHIPGFFNRFNNKKNKALSAYAYRRKEGILLEKKLKEIRSEYPMMEHDFDKSQLTTKQAKKEFKRQSERKTKAVNDAMREYVDGFTKIQSRALK